MIWWGARSFCRRRRFVTGQVPRVDGGASAGIFVANRFEVRIWRVSSGCRPILFIVWIGVGLTWSMLGLHGLYGRRSRPDTLSVQQRADPPGVGPNRVEQALARRCNDIRWSTCQPRQPQDTKRRQTNVS